MLITIDGPAGSGKSSVAKLIAKKLNYNYLDTGSMYRMITYYFLHKNIDINPLTISQELDNIYITYIDGVMYLNHENVDDKIRSLEVNQAISQIASSQLVREAMVSMQREIVKNGNFIADGRDLGTYVFPDCEHKFYLTASVDVRAKRRLLENIEKNLDTDLDVIKENIIARDYADMHREIAPLKQADDAILINTDDLTLEEVADLIINNL